MIDLLDKFGPTGGVLAALCIALWRFLAWCKPLATRLLEAAIALVESLQATTEKNAAANAKNAEVAQGIRDDVQGLTAALRETLGSRATKNKADDRHSGGTAAATG